MKTTRCLNETVVLDRNCDLGSKGDRATVTALDGLVYYPRYMTLKFEDGREVRTGADYKFLASVETPAQDDDALTLDELHELRQLARERAQDKARHPDNNAYFERLANKLAAQAKKLAQSES